MPYYLPAYATEPVYPWWDAARYPSWQTAGPELRRLLDHALFDIRCHSYSHQDMIPCSGDAAFLRQEIADAPTLVGV